MPDLLPINATPAERALSEAIARAGDIPTPLRTLWDPNHCPPSLLPWLAWALSVDDWGADWTDQQKRQTVAASYAVHKIKGTIGSLKTALQALGYQVEIMEWYQDPQNLAPYTFVVDIDANGGEVQETIFNEVNRIIQTNKNARSHLARFRLSNSTRGSLYAGGASVYGSIIESYDAGGVSWPNPGRRFIPEPPPPPPPPPRISEIVAFASAQSPRMAVYTVNGFDFTRLDTPAQFPGGNASAVKVCHVNKIIAFSHSSAPFLSVYSYATGSLLRLPTPAQNITGAGTCVDISPDGQFLAVGFAVTAGAASGLAIYKILGDQLLRITTGVNEVLNRADQVSFSPDGLHLAVAYNTSLDSNRLVFYNINGETFTRINTVISNIPGESPIVSSTATSLAWQPGHSRLFVGYLSAAGRLAVYTVSTIEAVRQQPTAEIPVGSVQDIAINSLGNLVCFGVNTAPFLLTYKLNGALMTIQPAADLLPANTVNTLSFNAEGTILAAGLNILGENAIFYAVNGGNLTRLQSLSSFPSGAVNGSSFD